MDAVRTFPGFLATLVNPAWRDETGAFEGAAAALEDVNRILSMLTEVAAGGSGGEIREFAHLATSFSTAYDVASVEVPPEGFDLTASNTSPADVELSRLVDDLDSYKLQFKTTEVHWRFPNTQCITNTRLVMQRAADLGITIEPWVGWLIRDQGAVVHAWIVRRIEAALSVCDLTLTRPEMFKSLLSSRSLTASEIDSRLQRIRNDSRLRESRVVGRVPDGWIYKGKPLDGESSLEAIREAVRHVRQQQKGIP